MSDFTPKKLTPTGEAKASALASAYDDLVVALGAAISDNVRLAQLTASLKSHSAQSQAAVLAAESVEI